MSLIESEFGGDHKLANETKLVGPRGPTARHDLNCRIAGTSGIRTLSGGLSIAQTRALSICGRVSRARRRDRNGTGLDLKCRCGSDHYTPSPRYGCSCERVCLHHPSRLLNVQDRRNKIHLFQSRPVSSGSFSRSDPSRLHKSGSTPVAASALHAQNAGPWRKVNGFPV